MAGPFLQRGPECAVPPPSESGEGDTPAGLQRSRTSFQWVSPRPQGWLKRMTLGGLRQAVQAQDHSLVPNSLHPPFIHLSTRAPHVGLVFLPLALKHNTFFIKFLFWNFFPLIEKQRQQQLPAASSVPNFWG